MRFILVQCTGNAVGPAGGFGLRQFRATYAGEEKTVDEFFWTFDVTAAKAHVRRKYPDATFSDEEA